MSSEKVQKSPGKVQKKTLELPTLSGMFRENNWSRSAGYPSRRAAFDALAKYQKFFPENCIIDFMLVKNLVGDYVVVLLPSEATAQAATQVAVTSDKICVFRR